MGTESARMQSAGSHMNATTTQPDIARALRLKRTSFLQKPFSFREMNDVVTLALGETLIGE